MPLPKTSSKINSVEELLAANRLLRILHKRLKKESFFEEPLMQQIIAYTNTYLSIHSKQNPGPSEVYGQFMEAYHKDMINFAETGKYPLQIDEHRPMLSRYAYNIILLFSCLFTPHRFRIMQLIQDTAEVAKNGLFIGCGPGLEFALVKSKIDHLEAYDLKIDAFLITTHPDIQFKEAYFDGKGADLIYDSIYLIELLEHLDQPYLLLEQCKGVLSDKGKIYLTTATNIPQFDHLYNFEPAHEDFEKRVQDLGLKVQLMEDIPHQAVTLDIQAKNRFYILSKDNLAL